MKEIKGRGSVWVSALASGPTGWAGPAGAGEPPGWRDFLLWAACPAVLGVGTAERRGKDAVHGEPVPDAERGRVANGSRAGTRLSQTRLPKGWDLKTRDVSSAEIEILLLPV